jgi:8-oxo-dGTP pyrophosphatase MutT (NUDIX family)
MVRRWREQSSEVLYQSRIFSIRRAEFVPQTSPGGVAGQPTQEVYLVDSPDWVNIIGITKQDTVLFVRQFRFGARRVTLEIPGGMIDPDETPEQAAIRELREETGYESSNWISLGSVDPNPALIGNRCYSFLARDCQRSQAPTPDPLEELSLEEHKLVDVPKLVASGDISHALVAVAFLKLDLHQRGLA